MEKTHLILKGGIGGEYRVVIGGHDLTNITNSVRLDVTAGGIPRIEIELFAFDCEVDANADVRLGGSSIPDHLARTLYEDLKARFEE